MRTIDVYAIGIGLCLLLAAVTWLIRARVRNRRRFRPMPNGQRIEVDPDDPTDAMHDPAVRAMFSEVIRTGRAMTMNRGEAPRFVDEATACKRCLYERRIWQDPAWDCVECKHAATHKISADRSSK